MAREKKTVHKVQMTDGTDSQIDDHSFICRQCIRPDVEQTVKEVEHLMHYDTANVPIHPIPLFSLPHLDAPAPSDTATMV